MRRSLAAAALAAAALAGWALWPTPRLALSDEAGRVLLHADALTLRYRHSVARTPVEEDFVAAPGGVRVVETRFESAGAGLPSQPEWGGAYQVADGAFSVVTMRGEVGAITIRIGYVSEQTALVGGRAIRLDALAPPGATLTLRSLSWPRLASLLSP